MRKEFCGVAMEWFLGLTVSKAAASGLLQDLF